LLDFSPIGSDIGYKIQQKNPPTPPILGLKAKLKTGPSRRLRRNALFFS
jgi:hypothetical protein